MHRTPRPVFHAAAGERRRAFAVVAALLRTRSPGRMPRRLVQLFGGLTLYGFSVALLVQAGLGLDSWNVLHQGLSRTFGLGLGVTVIAVGALVLFMWLPLRQRPGIGTVANVMLVGLAADLGVALIPAPQELATQALCLALGILLNGIATGAYIGAGLGPGPRDGIMTGIAARTGWTIRRVRTGIELGVLAIGWLLGGTVGVGTILYGLSIGAIVQIALSRLTVAAGRAGRHGGRRP